MVPITTQEQQAALDIVRTNNSIATAEQLAELIQNRQIPKYGEYQEGIRRRWLGQQVVGMNYLAHTSKSISEIDLAIEVSMIDQAIMDNPNFRGLTQVEMQEAFRRGIANEYGQYYSITAKSVIGFLQGFMKGEKRQKAKAIIYAQEEKKRIEENQRFWRELHRAHVEQGFELPDFKSKPFETYDDHRKKIEQQRQEIYKKANDDLAK